MPQFLVSGIDAGDNRVTEVVEAESSQAATKRMRSRGYHDVQLHTDDAGAFALDLELDDGPLTAEDVVNISGMPLWRYFLYLTAVYYRVMWWGLLIAASLIAFTLLHGTLLSVSGVVGLLLLASPILLAAWSAFTGASREYDALCEAVAWGKWNRILELTPKLRGKVPDLELDAREGLALASTGRLQEGIAILAKHEHDPDTPFWMYASRFTEVYDAAGEHEKSIELLNQALASAPENPSVQLEVAFALLKNRSDIPRARQLIEAGSQQETGDLLKILLPGMKGLLSLNEGRPRDAIPQLDEVVRGLQPLTGNRLVPLVQDTFRGYAAVAYAEAGDISSARKLAARTLPRLEAVGNHRLLKWMDEAIPTG